MSCFRISCLQSSSTTQRDNYREIGTTAFLSTSVVTPQIRRSSAKYSYVVAWELKLAYEHVWPGLHRKCLPCGYHKRGPGLLPHRVLARSSNSYGLHTHICLLGVSLNPDSRSTRSEPLQCPETVIEVCRSIHNDYHGRSFTCDGIPSL